MLQTDHVPNLEIPKHIFLIDEQQQRLDNFVHFEWTNAWSKKLMQES